MARISVGHPEIRALAGDLLIPLYLELGSVSAVTRALNDALAGSDHPVLHPNRIHGILSDDTQRSLNEQTLTSLRAAAAALHYPPERSIRARAALADVAARVRDGARSSPPDRDALADRVGVPAAVIREALGQGMEVARAPLAPARSAIGPDWSFQDVAVARCLDAFRRRPTGNVGLILPTGAGKTRIAFRIILEILSRQGSASSRALWITHRRSLKAQAHRELMALVEAGSQSLPAEAMKLADRVEFVMVGDVHAAIDDGERPALVVVDEAHHAASRSYQRMFETRHAFPVLLLTATPNRPDALPIGIDEIAFTITYRELANRGVIITPEFERFPVRDFSLSTETVDDLADRLAEDTAERFQKTLVLVSRVDQVELVHDRLVRAIGGSQPHPLSVEDVGFIHGSGNSLGLDAEDFLARFAAKPRAILVSAQMLLEGFDDPRIDAVVITYRTESVIKLMQAVGRCVRYAPGKKRAWVVQVDNPTVAYRFDQRWLYQEIDDRLLPKLVDVDFSDKGDLLARAAGLLRERGVDARGQAEAMAALASASPNDPPRLMFYGLPYFGVSELFEWDGKWGVFVETSANRQAFRAVYNRFSALGAEHSDPTEFLDVVGAEVGLDASDASLRRQLTGVLLAAFRAREELSGSGGAVHGNRGHEPNQGTTWISYVTFHHRPRVPIGLSEFLADCHNRGDVEEAYASEPSRWVLAIKTELPFGSFEAILLDGAGAASLIAWIDGVRDELRMVPPAKQFAVLAAASTRMQLPSLPGSHAFRVERLLSDAGRATLSHSLQSIDERTPQ